MKRKKAFVCLAALVCASALVVDLMAEGPPGSMMDGTVIEPTPDAIPTPIVSSAADGLEALPDEPAEGPANTELIATNNTLGFLPETAEFDKEPSDAEPDSTRPWGGDSNVPYEMLPAPPSNSGDVVPEHDSVSGDRPPVPGSRSLTFDLSPGSGAPPDSLGGYMMTDFPLDESSAVYADIMSIPSPCAAGGDIEFSVAVSHRRIGSGWATWSHGYTEDVYFSGTGVTSVTITLPQPACAFYFYVEPNPFEERYFTATADDGTSSGSFSAHGSAGAVYVGVFGEGLESVNIASDDGVTDFAIGEFGIGCLCEPMYVACCEELTGACTDGLDVLACIERDWRWDFGVELCADLDPPCGEVEGACCVGEAGEPPYEPYECIADMSVSDCLAAGEETFWVEGESCEGALPYGCGAPGLLYAPTNPDNAAFRQGVADLIGRTVDYYDPRTGTPTLEELEEYLAVFTWGNYAYADSVAMGDVLADFVDVGGKVILGQWTLHTTQVNWLEGRIMTEEYCPVTGSSYAGDSYAGDGFKCPTLDVDSFSSTSYMDQVTARVGALVDGTTVNGYDFTVYWPPMNVYYSPGNTGTDFDTGDTVQWTANMVTCIPEPMYGACCHPTEYGVPPGVPGFSGFCENDIELMDCLPPLKFYWEEQCEELEPLCGDPGCCCPGPEVGELMDPHEELVALCGGRHLSDVLGDDCEPYAFDPPDACGLYVACPHTITMRDDYGDGWNGGYIDVYLNDELLIGGLTLPSGAGPGYYYFEASTCDTIETVWTPGGWPYECNYCISSDYGEICCDGMGGVDPTGVICNAMCSAPTGACCLGIAGCEETTEAACAGTFLGYCTDCGGGADCDGDGESDVCAIAACPEENPDCQDCNENGVPDSCDISEGTSVDCQPNGIPDECEEDCNENGIADECDIADCGVEPFDEWYWCYDCQPDGIPDGCQIGAEDGRPAPNVLLYSEYVAGVDAYAATLDALGWTYTYTNDPYGLSALITAGGWTHIIANHTNTGAVYDWSTTLPAYLVANPDVICIVSDWRSTVPHLAAMGFTPTGGINYYDLYPVGGGLFDGFPDAPLYNPGYGIFALGTGGGLDEATQASGTGAITRSLLNECWFWAGPGGDCWEDVAIAGQYMTAMLECGAGAGADCNGNLIPDDCDIQYCDGSPWCLDCQPDGVPDGCEPDCNENDIADECDIRDCDPDDPDCQDCNDNEIPDWCDIEFCPEGFEFEVDCDDCNENGVPDWCDIEFETSVDCNDNGIPDDCEPLDDCDGDGIPDICDPDCNENGISDVCDMLWCGMYDPDYSCPEGHEYFWCDDCNDDGVLDACQSAAGGDRDSNDIMYTPANPDDAAFRTAVAELTGGVVDYVDPRTVVPTLEQMLAYGTVFTWVNYAYADNVAMGNNLADFADAGGKVILGQWCLPTAGNYLAGRIMDVDEGYLPCWATTRGSGTYAGDGEGCYTEDVTAYETSYRDNVTLLEGAENDGTYTDGTPFACYGMNPQVMVGAGYIAGFSTGDIAQMTANGHFCLGGVTGAGDCNENCIPDDCDIADCDGSPWCQDCQEDGVPDGCQLDPDCQGDLIPDDCQVEDNDCQPDGIPDDCQLDPDCQDDGIPDDCQLDERPVCCGDGYCAEGESFETCPQDCEEIVACEHSIEMYDSYGDGWNGCTIDVYVNGELVLAGATVPSGLGPEYAYFDAATGDEIFVDFTCVSWCSEPSYYVYGGLGALLGSAWGGYGEGEGDLTVTGDCETEGGGEGSGDCCWDHYPVTGCEDPVCEASVCSYDPFCCDYGWDSICAGEAMDDPNCDCGDGLMRQFTYQYDDGSTENGLGLTSGGELVWIHHFTAEPGAEMIDTIMTSFGWSASPGGSGVTPGMDVRVYVWCDPAGSGQATGATIVREATGSADAAAIETDIPQAIAIDPICIIEECPNESFFVGASVLHAAGYFPVPMDQTSPVGESWIAYVVGGPFDPTVMGGALAMSAIGYPCNHILRANGIACGAPANDCNENGVPDECDLDCNDNCVPDDCEAGPVTCGSHIIKQGACPAPFNRKSHGVLPIVLVGDEPPTEEHLYLDATKIDLSSIRLSRVVEAASCEHSITMWDAWGDGWNGCTIDVYVNGNLVLAGVTLATGAGPETVYFDAFAGDEIVVDFTCLYWCTEPSYCVYDGDGVELGCAVGGYNPGEGDLTVTANCAGGAGGLVGAVAPLGGGQAPTLLDMNHPYVGEGPCSCNEDQEGDEILDVKLKFSSDDVVEGLELEDLPTGELVLLVLTGNMAGTDQWFTSPTDCLRLVPPGTQGASLTIEASLPGVWINVDPLDETLDGEGFTDFVRAFWEGTPVTLTAEESFEGQSLRGWQIGGLLHHMGETTIEFVMDEDMTVKAVYGPDGEDLRPDPTAPESTGPDSAGLGGTTVDHR